MIKQEFNFLIHLFNWLGSFRRGVNIPIAGCRSTQAFFFFSWLHDIKTHHQQVIHVVRLWFIWQQRWTRSCASLQLRWEGDEHLITKRTSCSVLVFPLINLRAIHSEALPLFPLLTRSVLGTVTHPGMFPAKKRQLFAYLCLFVVCFSRRYLSTCTAIAELCCVVIWRSDEATWVAAGKCRRRGFGDVEHVASSNRSY